MADFVWTKAQRDSMPGRLEELYDYDFHPTSGLTVYGKGDTYTHMEEGDEFVTVIGYCYYPDKPVRQIVSEILRSFKESLIGNLKRKLIGQFLLIIKKHESIYVFADCLQARNVFYSQEGSVVSSSYSVVENALRTSGNDLDTYKVFEYMAMQHTMYPGWLGRTTMHKRIMRLRPYEYLVINTSDLTCRIGAVKFLIANNKESDIHNLSSELLMRLRTFIEQSDFRDDKVGVALTGGYDTRLVACIAAKYFKNISFRVAVSKDHTNFMFDLNSVFDLRVARKVAKVVDIPLDVYWSSGEPDKERFYKLTEGLAPSYNSTITPLIDASGSYAMGMGGVFGTELFYSVPYDTIEVFTDKAIARAKVRLDVKDVMWEQFRECMIQEFDDIKEHYEFAVPNERDQIRMFVLMNTGWLSSVLVSSYNINGVQLEPYGNMPIMEVAFKVSEQHLGRRTKLGETCLLQKVAMSNVHYNMGKIMTSHYCPMLPLSIRTVAPYLTGYLLHILYSANLRILKNRRRFTKVTKFSGGLYISDGWNSLFVRRIKEQYGDYVNMENA